jgi:WD40 repeat protein
LQRIVISQGGVRRPMRVHPFRVEHPRLVVTSNSPSRCLPNEFRLVGRDGGAHPVRLCYFEGRTHDEAADALGCPVGTVRGRLARARGLLRSRLTRRGIAPSTWLAAEGLAEAQSEISPTLHALTLAAATRGGTVRAEVATLAARVLRGMSATKAVAIAAGLAVTLIATGAGLAAILGRQDDGPRKAPQPAAVVQAPAPGVAKVDLFGDPLPRGAIARMGTVRFGHADGMRNRVSRALFADDGHSLVTVGEFDEVRVWDAASGRLIRSIDSDKAALSPDGKTLVTTTDGRAPEGKSGLIRVSDLVSGRELRRVEADSRTRYSLLTFSPDGSTLAGVVVHMEPNAKNLDVSLVFWDAATFTERLRRPWKIALPLSLAFAPDGRTLAVASADVVQPNSEIGVVEPEKASVKLLNIADGDEIRRFSVEGFGIASVAFSPDGGTLAAGVADRTARLFDVATGAERLPRLGREGAVPPPKPGTGARLADGARSSAALAFSPDGRNLASVAGDYVHQKDRAVRIWDVASGRALRRFDYEPCGGTAIAYLPDGRSLVTGGMDGLALTWDVSDLATLEAPTPLDQKALEALWADLASDDAARAHRASFALSVAEAVPFLRGRLKPVASPDHLAALIAGLDAATLAERAKASDELARLGEDAAPELRRALAARPSAEARGRIEALLASLKGPATSPEVLRTLRAIAALERVGTPEARAVLDRLANGMAAARETVEAKAVLDRWGSRAKGR